MIAWKLPEKVLVKSGYKYRETTGGLSGGIFGEFSCCFFMSCRRKDASFELYRPFVETRGADVVANIVITLICQTGTLLQRQIRALEAKFLREGGIREQMTACRLAVRKNDENDERDAGDAENVSFPHFSHLSHKNIENIKNILNITKPKINLKRKD